MSERDNTPAPPPLMTTPSSEVIKDAAIELLDNLWRKSWSGSRTHEENWTACEREFPGVTALHEALKKIQPPESMERG